jgi:hypothetical protein
LKFSFREVVDGAIDRLGIRDERDFMVDTGAM